MAALVMFVCIVFTIVPLAAVVIFFANMVAYENGRFDHRRLEPTAPPYHPEFHTQLRGREAN